MCWKMVVKNQEEMESKMDGLAVAADGCSCDKVLQIIARTRLDAPAGRYWCLSAP